MDKNSDGSRPPSSGFDSSNGELPSKPWESMRGEPSEEDWLRAEQESLRRREQQERSPLLQRPNPGALNGPAVFVAFCCLASAIYWWHPAGQSLVGPRGEVFQVSGLGKMFMAMMVHSNISHLVSNAGLFLLFGWLLRAYIGVIAFPLGAILAGIVTQILSLWTYPANVVLIGASGMVYAMAGMWQAYYIRFEDRRSMGARLFRCFGFSLVVLLPTQMQANVSYRAHGIGFVVGIVIAVLSYKRVQEVLERRRYGSLLRSNLSANLPH